MKSADRDRFGRPSGPPLDCEQPPAWRYLAQLPQGRKAARVSELFRVRGGPCRLKPPAPITLGTPISEYQATPGSLFDSDIGVRRAPLGSRCRTGWLGLRRGGTLGALPPLPARDVRRGHRSGPRHDAAAGCAEQEPGPPRLPVLRPPRMRK